MIEWRDLNEVNEWMRLRWRNLGNKWTDEAVAAVKADLPDQAQPEDMWSYLHHYLEKNPDFPPEPAHVISGTTKATRLRLKQSRQTTVPSGTPWKSLTEPPSGAEGLKRFLATSGFGSWEAAVEHYAEEAKVARLGARDPADRARWERWYDTNE